ncbi:hypothetical protein V1477_015520, partial [Vespula maculifrons]
MQAYSIALTLHAWIIPVGSKSLKKKQIPWDETLLRINWYHLALQTGGYKFQSKLQAAVLAIKCAVANIIKGEIKRMFVLVVVEYGGLRHCVMQPSRGCNDSKAGARGAGATAAPAPAADRNSCRKENYSSSLSPLSSSSLAAVACQRTVDLRTRFRPGNLSLTFVTEVHRPNSPNLLF